MQMPIPMILRPGVDPVNSPPVLARASSHSYFFEPLDDTRVPYTASTPPPPLPCKPALNSAPTSIHAPTIPPKPYPRPKQSSPQHPKPPPKPHPSTSTWPAPQGPPPHRHVLKTASSDTAVQQPLSPSAPRLDEEQDEVFKRVLAQSARESEERQQTLLQEDQDLARALQESLAITQERPRSLTVPSSHSGSHRYSSSIASPVDIPVSLLTPQSSDAGTFTPLTPLTPASSVHYIPDSSDSDAKLDITMSRGDNEDLSRSSMSDNQAPSQEYGRAPIPTSAPPDMSHFPPHYDEVAGTSSSTDHDRPRLPLPPQSSATPTQSAVPPGLGRSISAQPSPSPPIPPPELKSRRGHSFAGHVHPTRAQPVDAVSSSQPVSSSQQVSLSSDNPIDVPLEGHNEDNAVSSPTQLSVTHPTESQPASPNSPHLSFVSLLSACILPL